jgi:hypothetical protein
MSTIINPDETAAARDKALADIEKEVSTFGRRAKSPADKVAYAELQQELMEVRTRWKERGLLAEPEPLAA